MGAFFKAVVEAWKKEEGNAQRHLAVMTGRADGLAQKWARGIAKPNRKDLDTICRKLTGEWPAAFRAAWERDSIEDDDLWRELVDLREATRNGSPSAPSQSADLARRIESKLAKHPDSQRHFIAALSLLSTVASTNPAGFLSVLITARGLATEQGGQHTAAMDESA